MKKLWVGIVILVTAISLVVCFGTSDKTKKQNSSGAEESVNKSEKEAPKTDEGKETTVQGSVTGEDEPEWIGSEQDSEPEQTESEQEESKQEEPEQKESEQKESEQIESEQKEESKQDKSEQEESEWIGSEQDSEPEQNEPGQNESEQEEPKQEDNEPEEEETPKYDIVQPIQNGGKFDGKG